MALGLLVVVTLPTLAYHVPHPGRIGQAQYSATAAGVLALTAIYVYVVAKTQPALDKTWMSWTLLYGSGLVIVKFLLSPAAFERSSTTSLVAFVSSGLAVMPLYLAALALLHVLVGRSEGKWSLPSKLGTAAGLALGAVVTRLVVAFILGTASEYIENLFGIGLIMPAVVAIASFAVMGSFEAAGHSLRFGLGVGVAMVVSQHLLWVVFMYRVFS